MSTDLVLAGEVIDACVAAFSPQPTDVDGLVNQWLIVHASGSPDTYTAYRRDITDWLNHCTQYGIDPLHPGKSNVDAWHRLLAQTPGPSGRLPAKATLARKVSVVASFYHHLVDEDIIEAVPVRRSTRPKAPKDSQTVGLSAAEAAALQTRLGKEQVLERAVILTLLMQGLRISELLGMAVGSLRHNAGETTMVVHGKGGKVREIPVAKPVQEALGELLTSRFGEEPPPKDALVFVTVIGAALNRLQVDRMIKRVARAAGIRSWAHLSPHSMRHTCATLMFDAGVPLHVVQAFLGHSSPDTTGRYDRARGALSRSAVAVRSLTRLIADQAAAAIKPVGADGAP